MSAKSNSVKEGWLLVENGNHISKVQQKYLIITSLEIHIFENMEDNKPKSLKFKEIKEVLKIVSKPGFVLRTSKKDYSFTANNEPDSESWIQAILSLQNNSKQPEPVLPPQNNVQLPPGWEARQDPQGIVYFVDHNTKTTSYTPPKVSPNPPVSQTPFNPSLNSAKNQPTSSTPSLYPILPSTPQNLSLPEGWEEKRDQIGKPYFVNHKAKTTTYTDPRNPLPNGWEMRFNPQGIAYYVDHNRKITTFEDPRSSHVTSQSVPNQMNNSGPQNNQPVSTSNEPSGRQNYRVTSSQSIPQSQSGSPHVSPHPPPSPQPPAQPVPVYLPPPVSHQSPSNNLPFQPLFSPQVPQGFTSGLHAPQPSNSRRNSNPFQNASAPPIYEENTPVDSLPPSFSSHPTNPPTEYLPPKRPPASLVKESPHHEPSHPVIYSSQEPSAFQ